MPEIKEADASQMPHAAELWNAGYPLKATTASELVRYLEFEPHLRSRNWIAWDGETPVGLGCLERYIGSYHPQKWVVFLTVMESHRRQGIGEALWQTLQSAIPEPPISIQSPAVADDDKPSLNFAEKRGFKEAKRDFESELVLDDYRFRPEMAIDEYRFTTIEEADSPEFRHAMHVLYELVRADIPRTDPPTPLDYAFFESDVLAHADLLRHGSVLAYCGEQLVGFTTMYTGPQEGHIDTGLTAVARSARGRGLATELKTRAINWAKRRGYKLIRTDNDTRNAAMLAVNSNLGFRRLKGTVTLVWTPD